jgi:hypothetical protein
MSETSNTPSPPRVRTRWQPKHTVTIAAMICIAVVFLPVAAQAASQLVNIADPADPNRLARVSSDGALVVEQRPGNINAITSTELSAVTGTRRLLFQTTSPTRYAISELSATANSNAGTSMTIAFERWIHSGGTGPCPANPTSVTGFARAVLRTVKLGGQQTVQLTFPTPLLGSPQGPVNGTPICLYAAVTGPTSTSALVGVSGYQFLD